MQQNVIGTVKLETARKESDANFGFQPVVPTPVATLPAARWIDGSTAKRIMDLVGASIILLFFLPIFALISVVLGLFHSGPVFFRHRRLGRGGVPFSCLKFRTMHTDADRVLAECLKTNPAQRREWAQTQKLKSDPRVLPIGRLLRKASLDELPQLINVLRGDMSLVGPRPIVHDEVAHYGSDFASYIGVRPGITGLWQVSGRNNTTYAERVALDVRYVKERSMLGDICILLRTVHVVLTGHGAY